MFVMVRYPDVEFKLREKSIFSHKVMLASASQVFMKKFDTSPNSPRAEKKVTQFLYLSISPSTYLLIELSFAILFSTRSQS